MAQSQRHMALALKKPFSRECSRSTSLLGALSSAPMRSWSHTTFLRSPPNKLDCRASTSRAAPQSRKLPQRYIRVKMFLPPVGAAAALPVHLANCLTQFPRFLTRGGGLSSALRSMGCQARLAFPKSRPESSVKGPMGEGDAGSRRPRSSGSSLGRGGWPVPPRRMQRDLEVVLSRHPGTRDPSDTSELLRALEGPLKARTALRVLRTRAELRGGPASGPPRPTPFGPLGRG